MYHNSSDEEEEEGTKQVDGDPETALENAAHPSTPSRSFETARYVGAVDAKHDEGEVGGGRFNGEHEHGSGRGAKSRSGSSPADDAAVARGDEDERAAAAAAVSEVVVVVGSPSLVTVPGHDATSAEGLSVPPSAQAGSLTSARPSPEGESATVTAEDKREAHEAPGCGVSVSGSVSGGGGGSGGRQDSYSSPRPRYGVAGDSLIGGQGIDEGEPSPPKSPGRRSLTLVAVGDNRHVGPLQVEPLVVSPVSNPAGGRGGGFWGHGVLTSGGGLAHRSHGKPRRRSDGNTGRLFRGADRGRRASSGGGGKLRGTAGDFSDSEPSDCDHEVWGGGGRIVAFNTYVRMYVLSSH